MVFNMLIFKKINLRITEDVFGPPLIILLFCGFLLYMNTFLNTWAFDDYYVILKNPDVLSFKNFLSNTYHGRPLRELTFLFDYSLFGFNAFGWHFQNILWHVLNSWLIYVVAILLLDERRVAWVASVLFLVHPVNVEVVAQISHRKDSLALFFMLSAFVAYLLFQKHKQLRYFVITVLLTLVGFLAKENTFIFPLFLMIYHLSSLREQKVSLRWILLLMLVITTVIFSVKLHHFDYVERASALLINNQYFEDFNWYSYILAVLNAWTHSAVSFIWPVNLSVNYLLTVPKSLLDLNVISALLLVLLFLGLLAHSLYHQNFLRLPLLWVGILFIPVANVIPINHFAADRYLYAPSAGLCLGISFLLIKVFSFRKALSLSVCVVVCLSFLTFKQNYTWKDNLTLWSHSLDVNPKSARAMSNVGSFLYRNQPTKNLNMQLKAIATNPMYPFSYIKAAKIYETRGEALKAYDYYQKAYDVYQPATFGMYKETYDDLMEKLSVHQRSGS